MTKKIIQNKQSYSKPDKCTLWGENFFDIKNLAHCLAV